MARQTSPWPATLRRVRSTALSHVLGHQMAWVEAGTGRPIVLPHGNPSSSSLWRSVLPELEGLGRCIVPDLIGMGDSDGDPAV
jgi:haloalkane dehalogenase